MTLGAGIHRPVSGHSTVQVDAASGPTGRDWPYPSPQDSSVASTWYRVGLNNEMQNDQQCLLDLSGHREGFGTLQKATSTMLLAL